MLHQGIRSVVPSERDLVLVCQVQVIDTTDQRLEALSMLQGMREGRHQRGLAGALDAIEADEEGPRGVCGVVEGEAREDEGDAVRRLVVDDGGARGGRWACHG